MTSTKPKPLLWAELLALFVALPIALSFERISRWQIHACLWIMTGYALFHLARAPDFSWRKIWNGAGWPEQEKRKTLIRFLALAPVLIAFAWFFAPERFLGFPLQRPGLWALVMILYPVLSVMPQELVYRTFFFERYKPLASHPWIMIALSAFCFGFVHVVYHNWLAPVLSAIGGLLFASSYNEHRSLKWVSVEHALYGCLVFTLGLGWFFFGAARP